MNQQADDPRSVWAEGFVGRLVLQPGERVLDLSGGGDDGRDPVARLAAQRVGPAGAVARLELDPALALPLPFEDGEFDAVLCVFALDAHANPAGVLAEIRRVTATTGRIGIGVLAPAGDHPTELSGLVAQAGFRGVHVTADPGPVGPEQLAAYLVTAFPPRPETGQPAGPVPAGGSVDEPTVLLEVPAAAQPATGRAGGRWRLLAASVVVLLAAAAIGVGWGLAGNGDAGQDSGSAAGPAGGAAGDAGPGGPVPGASGEPGDQPGGGGGQPGGSGSGTGSGDGSSNGGPGNQPPVIEDAGLSSEGLTLTVAPVVADRDGDPVSVEVTADGEPVALSGDPASGTISYPYPTYGAAHVASVTIVATDAAGASTSETFTHSLQVVTTVSMEDVRFTLTGNIGRCLGGDVRARRLIGTLTLSGPVADTIPVNLEFRLDRTEANLMPRREGSVTGDRDQAVRFEATFAGQTATISETYDRDRIDFHLLFTETDGCRGLLSYRVRLQRH